MYLDPARGRHQRPLVIQGGSFPVIAGVGAGGQDANCPTCRETLLANIPEGGVLDLAIQCQRCGATALTPVLPPGRAVPAIAYPVVQPVLRADRTFVAEHDEVVVGGPALERRAAEVAASVTPPRLVMDIGGIEAILERAKRIFSPILRDVLGPYQRAPGVKPHQLAELIVAVEDNLASLQAGSVEVDVINGIELERVNTLFERWQREPHYRRLLVEARDGGLFVHNRMLLAVASLLADTATPLGFEFVEPAQDRRADFALRISARRAVHGDVKTPEPLQRVPNRAVSAKHAARLIRDVVKKSRGQVAADQPSILVIGGAFWGAEMDEHARAAAALFAPNRRKNLLGVVFASTAIQYRHRRGLSGADTVDWSEVDWSSQADLRWVPNPGYDLDLRVTFAADMTDFSASFRPE